MTETDRNIFLHEQWNARVRRVAKALDLEVHAGEPNDALTIRVEDLEELARRLNAR